jgi:hypothetical protein
VVLVAEPLLTVPVPPLRFAVKVYVAVLETL